MMKLHLKISIIAAVGILISTLAASFMLADLFIKQAKAERESSAIQLRKAARAFIEVRDDQIADRLTIDIEKEVQAGVGANYTSQNEFVAVGLLNPPLTGGAWTGEWIKSANAKLDLAWVNSLISQLPIERVRNDEYAWARVAGADGQVYFMFLSGLQIKSDSGAQNKISFGVMPLSIFSDLSLITKGEKESLFIVDGQGYTYGYPDQQYVGSKVSTHPIVNMLMSSPAIDYSSRYKELSGAAAVGGYEKIGHANIYVVSTSPLNTRNEIVFKFLLQIGSFAIGTMTIVFLLIFALSSREARNLEIIKNNLKLTQANKPQDQLLNQDSTETFKKYTYAVSNYLRHSMMAILSMLKIVESRVSEGDKKSIWRDMQNEMRRVNEFIEAMYKHSGRVDGAPESILLNHLLAQILSPMQMEFGREKIQCEKKLNTDIAVKAQFNDLKFAIKTIFQFVFESVASGQAAKEKQILIDVEQLGVTANIKFIGRGAKLSSDVVRELFVPYRVKIVKSELGGLDLALAQSAILALGGDIKVENINSDAFSIVIKLPSNSKVSQLAPEQPLAQKSDGADVTLPAHEQEFMLKRVVEVEKFNLPPSPEEIAKQISEQGSQASESPNLETISIRKPKVREDN